MKKTQFTFECDVCHADTLLTNGYCMDDEPWKSDAKWYCGKCYRDMKPQREYTAKINRRGTEVGERST